MGTTITRPSAGGTAVAAEEAASAWFLVCAAVASTLVTLVWNLRGATRSYSYDESVTVGLFVDADLLTPLTSQHIANNHPAFSFLEQLVWRLGGTTEAWMRVLPASFAALSVGVLVWWCSQRWGVLSGLTAGLVLGTSPLFVHFGQLARGYSLLVLCGLVATILVFELLTPGPSTRACATLYVVIAAIGLATHLYMAIVLAGHVGIVISRRSLSPNWLIRWAGATALALMVYLPALPERRPGNFRPGFPLDTAYEVLGSTPASVAILGAVCVAAVWAHRQHFLVFSLPLALLAVIWVGLHPLDLYPRFFVIFVPAVAVACGWAVSKGRWLVLPLAVACVAMLELTAQTDSGIRPTAELVTSLASDGIAVCAVGREALVGYGPTVPEFSASRDCDVIAIIGSWEPNGLDAARDRLGTSVTLGDVEIVGS